VPFNTHNDISRKHQDNIIEQKYQQHFSYATFPSGGCVFTLYLQGIVAIVFFSSGAVFSLIAGRLADLMKRTTLVSGCMLLGASGSGWGGWI